MRALVIIDRSGSMSGKEPETSGLVNRFVAELDDDDKVTVVTFDDRYDVIRSKVKKTDFTNVTTDEVSARGMTALNDAVYKGLTSYKKDKPTMVVIVTDGQENASKETTNASVKKLVEEKQALGWKFEFFGAGIDAFAAGGHLGIRAQGMKNISNDAMGYATASLETTASLRAYKASVGEK